MNGSNIPLARKMIGEVLTEYKLRPRARRNIVTALRLMRRRQPDFVHAREYRELTPEEKRKCRRLRSLGYSLAKIGKIIGVPNSGRISEAVNGKAHYP